MSQTKVSRLINTYRLVERIPYINLNFFTTRCCTSHKFLLPKSSVPLTQIQKSFHILRPLLDESNPDNKNDGDDNNPNKEENNVQPNENSFQKQLVIPSMNVLAPIQVPEFLAKVPCVAIARNPLFPRFIKMIEVTDKNLIELIRRKVHMNIPFIGVFMRKDLEREDDVVSTLDEVYQVGTFSQITELQDLGDKMRMIVIGHRRISINSAAADIDEKPTDLSSGSTLILSFLYILIYCEVF